MGKKSRSAPGRRPILRLSPPGPRREEAPGPPLEGADSGSEPEEPEAVAEPPRSAPNPPAPAPAAAVKPTGGLCLLGAYADSDEEEGESSEKPPRASGTNGNNSDIDSTLANFLAEIDAITAPPQPAEPSPSHTAVPSSSSSSSVPPPTPPRPEPKDSGSGSGSQPPPSTTNGAAPAPEWQYDTQCSLAGVGELEMGDWQEVWDENTGCYYYWNTQSNEVTWELPQYLATQVQGLQHYQHSANGSFMAEPYSQEKGVRGAKREVKKEVNEGVQALSNNEEEKKGVAAALLAPLLPEGVKEEEERWRRKVICKEEVVEPPPEEESKAGEVTVVAAGPQEPEAIREPLEEPLQEELCSVVQSGESGEEEEEEQDTLELEMVLERKKAELRALEEGEGSISGSSPLSDGSQGASQDPARRLASKRGKWKLFVGAASPEAATRGSKTGRESPEVGETATNVETTEATSDKEAEPEEPQEKPKPQGAPKLEEEEQDLKFQIGELANTLTSKLEFLGINRQSISNFHLLLLQTETRIADWREGALNGNYLKRKLQDAAEQLKQYEINATPKGWSCHWDRISGSTLLTNSSAKGQTPPARRNEEQDFCLLPAGSIDAISMLTSARESRSGNSLTGRRKRKESGTPRGRTRVLLSPPPRRKENAPGTPPRDLQAPFVRNPSQDKFLPRPSCRSLHFGLCFSPRSRFSNLLCLWKCLHHLHLPPSRLPRRRPLLLLHHPHHHLREKMGRSKKWRWKMKGVRNRPPRERRRMHPSNLCCAPLQPAPSSVDTSPVPLLSVKPQKRKAVEMSPGVLQQRAATIGSCPVIYSQPLMAATKYQPSALPLASLRPRQRLQSDLQARPNLRLAPGPPGPQPTPLGLQSGYLGVTAPPVMGYSECNAAVSVATTNTTTPAAPARGAPPAAGPTEQPPPPPPPQTPPPPTPKAPLPPEKEKPKKGRKEKGKKGKTKMPSLVKKWQSIQRELDEEENSSSSEEDRETTAQRRIEEWKQQQLMSGMAERNANFEALPEDWRARLKRRKTASST